VGFAPTIGTDFFYFVKATHMPFLGFATTEDLNKLRSDLDVSITEDLNKLRSDLDDCTQIINGVHICSVPKYNNVIDPKQTMLSTLFDSDAKGCIRFEQLVDVIGPGWNSNMFGHGNIPDNYICFDGGKTTQYFEAWFPPGVQPHARREAHNITVQQFLSHSLL
jgi:hypothetical protein